MKRKSVQKWILLGLIVCLALMLFACGEEETKMLDASEIAYLDEIQAKDNLCFEWVRAYNPEYPTLVVVHGETAGRGTEKFTVSLDEEEYTFKTGESSDYVVATGIGYKARGLDLDLSKYWLDVAKYNVAIFHWERFADETSDNVLAKLFSVPKMKYKTDGDGYETNAVPKNCLTEVFAALYVKEFADKSTDKEIRWVGNGVGADLAAAAADYMLSFVKKGSLDKKYLPDRLTLCDPYLPAADLHLANDKTKWGVDSTEGAMGLVKTFVSDLDAYAAIEVVESKEVVTAEEETTTTYAYDLPKSEKAESAFKQLKKHVAYLELSESYSRLFSDAYKAQKRIALDWYLYSVIGSDDSGNAGASAAVGYPRKLSDYETYYTYTGFNWGTNETRPMINNRALNNDSSVDGAKSRGKNLSLSAWTPTTYTKGLTGVSFSMKKSGTSLTQKDIHGNTMYIQNDYVMVYFRSENFQVSDVKGTTVSGYVYLDKNKNATMDDGKAGVKNVRLHVSVVAKEKVVDTFVTYTDESGHYSIFFKDGELNTEDEVVNGYSLETEHTVTIQVEPNSSSYLAPASASTTQYYDVLSANNFAAYSTTVTLNAAAAHSVLVANCLVKPIG